MARRRIGGADGELRHVEASTADDGGEAVRRIALTRPEPFEQTFGAEAHPAEPAASDPTASRQRRPRRRATAEPEQPQADPAGDTEQ